MAAEEAALTPSPPVTGQAFRLLGFCTIFRQSLHQFQRHGPIRYEDWRRNTTNFGREGSNSHI
jgi:hypothetical protein